MDADRCTISRSDLIFHRPIGQLARRSRDSAIRSVAAPHRRANHEHAGIIRSNAGGTTETVLIASSASGSSATSDDIASTRLQRRRALANSRLRASAPQKVILPVVSNVRPRDINPIARILLTSSWNDYSASRSSRRTLTFAVRQRQQIFASFNLARPRRRPLRSHGS